MNVSMILAFVLLLCGVTGLWFCREDFSRRHDDPEVGS